jgi:hypothetical protein
MAFADDDFRMINGGGILSWNGSSLSTTFSGPSDSFTGTTFSPSGPLEGWVVGTDAAGGNRTRVYQWTGEVWTRIQTPDSPTLYDVAFGGSFDRILAVGSGPTVLTWSGSAGWNTLIGGTSSTDALVALAVYPKNIWMVGSSGQTWTIDESTRVVNTSPVSGTTSALLDVVSIAGTDVWAVGALGAVVHKAGSSAFVSATNGIAPTTASFTGICANAANDLWIVGNGGQVFHGDGSSWTPSSQGLGGAALSKIICPGGDPWAIDNSHVWHYSSGIWSSSIVTTGFPVLQAISNSDSKLWIVGNGGAVIQRSR